MTEGRAEDQVRNRLVHNAQGKRADGPSQTGVGQTKNPANQNG